MATTVCSKCEDPIIYEPELDLWRHVSNGRIGGATREQYRRHVELGCLNKAVPRREDHE